MNFNRGGLVLGTALVLYGCGPRLMMVLDPVPYFEPGIEVTFPESFGDALKIGEAQDPRPGQGITLKYAMSAAASIEITIYSLERTEIQPWRDSAAVYAHFTDCLADIHQLEKRGTIARFRAGEDSLLYSHALGRKGIPVHLVRFTYFNQLVRMNGMLVVTTFRNHFIRVRCAYPEPMAPRAEPAFDAVVKFILQGFLG
jgi:hypothetical protein